MDFELLGRVRLGAKARAALKNASAEMTRALTHYDHHVDAAINDPRVSKSSANFLRRQWYEECFDQPLSLGNRPVREAIFVACTKTLLRAAEADPSLMLGKPRARMLTTCPDLGYHSLDGAELAVLPVANHFVTAMRAAYVEGFGLLDVSLIRDRDGVSPDVLGMHFHGAIRSEIPTFKPKLAARIASGRKLVNKFGLKIAAITYESNLLCHDDVAGLAYYMTKISCGTKEGRGDETYTSHQRWSLKPALRGLEAYSHFEALDCLRGLGDWGRGMRKACKEELRIMLEIDRLPYGVHLDHDALRRHWGRLYCELGFNVTVPFEIG